MEALLFLVLVTHLERPLLIQMHNLQPHRADIVAIAMYLNRNMSEDTHVSWATSKPSIELFGIDLSRNLPFLRSMINDLERADVVADQAEAAAELTVSTGLDVPAEMDVGALAVGDEDTYVT